jgi:hypothetical protein
MLNRWMEFKRMEQSQALQSVVFSQQPFGDLTPVLMHKVHAK